MVRERFEVLDGWRGLSIIFVLACHLLPLGPKVLQLNFSAGLMGMTLFFTLSGFLITHFLLYRSSVVDFLVRRFFRILPLAWTYIIISLLLYSASRDVWMAHMFFYLNYEKSLMVPLVTEHIWSLCVEIQFYVGVALLVTIFKKRGLLFLPAICVGITLLRIWTNTSASIETHLRVDEILAGAILALIYDKQFGEWLTNFVRKQSFYVLLVLLLLSCHHLGGWLMYLRPYFAALLIGNTLLNPTTKINEILNNKVLIYIASISYALYVIHPLLASSWLGSGDLLTKYSKRPILFAVLFLTAHFSTFYFEHRFMAWGKGVSNKLQLAK